jgi:hypothetical protein
MVARGLPGMMTAKHSVSIENVFVDGDGNSSAIFYGDFEKGMVFVPAGSLLTLLIWYTSDSEDGEYYPVINSSGAVSQSVVENAAYPIPSDLKGARFLKIAGDAVGVVGVTLKD